MSSKKKHIFVLTAVFVIVAASFFWLGRMSRSDKDQGKTDSQQKTEEEQKTEAEQNIEMHAENPQVDEEYISKDLGIDTPYGVIHFPAEFSDYTHIEVEEAEEQYKVVFFCKYEENKIPLFEVSIGEAGEDAQIIGQLIDTEDIGKNVSVRIYELTPDTEWAEKNAELLYAMQEAVNYVRENFESDYEFRK